MQGEPAKTRPRRNGGLACGANVAQRGQVVAARRRARDRLARVALYAIHVFGTFPPLAASWRMTSLWSQTFILDEPFVFPE